jgi:HSP20 family protein
MNRQKLTPWNWFRSESTSDRLPAQDVRSRDPFARMHQEMDRLFEDFFDGRRAGGERMLEPSVDIAESKKAYRIEVEVPGIDPKDIEVHVDDGMLIISGEKQQETEDEDEGFHRVERRYGRFRRTLSLPDDADGDRIQADARRGVLKIRIPRRPVEDKPGTRRIEIAH